MSNAKLALSIPEAAAAAGIGRSLLYESMAAGELRFVKLGRRRLIRVAALDDWLKAHEQGGPAAGLGKASEPSEAA